MARRRYSIVGGYHSSVTWCRRCGAWHKRGHHRAGARHRHRRNPKSRTIVYSRGGGSNLGLYLLIGGAAYFLLLRPGGIGSIFGGAQPAIPGYTALGGNAYRNDATGQVVTRTATGQLVTSTGVVAPSGVPNWLQPTVQAGAMAIPQIGIGLAQGLVGALNAGVRQLFGGSGVTGTTAPDGTEAGTVGGAGTTTTAPDILSGSYLAPLPPLPGGALPDLALSSPLGTEAPLPDLTVSSPLGSLPPLPDTQLSLNLAPVDTSTWFTDTSAPPPDASFF